jgi:putative transcriptional regulator
MPPMGESLAGKLLVATPALLDENFYRTVVLLLAHDDNGAFGIVLNRPLDSSAVGDHIPAWEEHVAAPGRIFAGGPVEPAMALGLAAAAADSEPEGWMPMTDGYGLIDLGSTPDSLDVVVQRVRVFTGYAGWGAGQVEGEVAANAWFVLDAEPGDAFTAEPHTLWRRVLERQRSDLRMYALFPEDPRQN